MKPFDEEIAVGTELPPLDPGAISRATLAMFGPASGDYHPIHLDIDVARSAGMDDVFAHGMLSMAYLGRLLTNWVGQDRIREISTRFTAITPIYGRPRCTGVVSDIREEHGERVAVVDLSVVLEDGTLTLTGSATIRLS